ncbi:prenyltransferase/squalene oxidase repeat-containing protein [Sphaerisporangium sp. TRM90804]|uniref:prenyltransferase/squalene oxidase repeat-containing protein n=1 Tax=Sphaerisporangium sp. TRM90804 TaxID=3031113 RepID=UPI00244CABDA|nr:prenyltransferase/squalene oxidase repeat-containing protein [Sphaerisporangium sp. TRM90804]MDH2424673.1 prenyltransferase/squalene oxidase repeat-containing protein [Sphaerisporangium sp. TRM90804]
MTEPTGPGRSAPPGQPAGAPHPARPGPHSAHPAPGASIHPATGGSAHSAQPGDPAAFAHAAQTGEAAGLVAGLLAQPWGRVTPSVYETGRLVTIAPWLAGHAERLGFLAAAQRPDGGWGPHEDYRLVPTLSATEAMLSELRREPAAGHADLAARAERGLRALFGRPGSGGPPPPPDLPAVELVVPYLTGAINRHLRDLGPAAGALAGWAGRDLPLPEGMDEGRLAKVRSLVRAGAAMPEKLAHALEVAGDAAEGARGVARTPAGTVGASPAATAAWLGDRVRREPGDPARSYLEAVVAAHGGPVPCGLPITVFERGWVLSWLLRAGVPVRAPEPLVASLRHGIDPDGIAAGPGLPADADTTSVALYALALLGAPRDPASLAGYRVGPHYQTWRGENGVSTTTNAHVLDALGAYRPADPAIRARYAATAGGVAGWLRDRQHADGSWTDRWHTSPYYATMCCALALDAAGPAGRPSPEVRRSVRWLLSTQRADGSWGLWRGTAEETAYAMHVLLLTGAGREDPEHARAAVRGGLYLRRGAVPGDDPPMWVDKDLYTPLAVVHAAVLAALHLVRHHSGLTVGYGSAGGERAARY